MTRIAFAADLHADDFGSRVDPSTGLNARFLDSLVAIEHIADEARIRDVDALVVAGDYTEHRSPAPPRVARILAALRGGPRRQVHVRGNHDTERGGRSIVDVLGSVDGWEGFTQPGISIVDDVAICAIPFLAPSHLRAAAGMEHTPAADVYRALGEAYLSIARGLYVQADSAGLTPILVGHQQLAGGQMNDSQAAFLGALDVVIDSRAMASIGFAAAIFGHVHRAQTVVDDPACPVLFVGSAHRVDFAEEHEEKRFVVADVQGGRVSIESVPIPARRFVTIDWETTGRVEGDVAGAIVRVLNVPPEEVADVLRDELASGAFEVHEIRQRRAEAPAIAGGMAEGMTAPAALEEFFAEDEDREALVERGRGILEAVAA